MASSKRGRDIVNPARVGMLDHCQIPLRGNPAFLSEGRRQKRAHVRGDWVEEIFLQAWRERTGERPKALSSEVERIRLYQVSHVTYFRVNLTAPAQRAP